ncbi:MAG: hypothetical protein ACYDGX_03935 [Thermoleophilia bacterium]
MFFIILAFIVGVLFAFVCGAVAYAVFKQKEKSARDWIAAVMLTAVGIVVFCFFPFAGYSLVIPSVNDSNRHIVKTDVYPLERIAPGQSLIVGDVANGSGSTSSRCTGYVINEDGKTQMLGIWSPCKRPNDNFDTIEGNEGNVDAPILKVEWLVAPAEEYDYGWFSIDFKMINYEATPSYKKAIIEVPAGEKLDFSNLSHQS